MEISPVTVLPAVCGRAARIVPGVRRDLHDPLEQKIRAVFAGSKGNPWSRDRRIRRRVAAPDASFDVVCESAKRLNLDLRKMT